MLSHQTSMRQNWDLRRNLLIRMYRALKNSLMNMEIGKLIRGMDLYYHVLGGKPINSMTIALRLTGGEHILVVSPLLLPKLCITGARVLHMMVRITIG